MTDSQQQQIYNHHRAAQQAIRKGDLRSTHQHCLAILKLDPTFADAWFLCGVIAASNGLQSKAIDILVRAVGLASSRGEDNPEYRAELGKLLLADNQHDKALEQARAALLLNPHSPPVLNTLGTLLSHCGEHDKALQCFEKAAAAINAADSSLSPLWQSEFHFNRGASLQFAGRLEDAENAYEKAIELEATKFKAHSALATLRKYNHLDNHLERLRSLLDKVSNPRDQLHLGHAIAKELEDIAEYDSSLEYLAWAKQGLADAVGYSAARDGALFKTIAETFSDSLMAQAVQGCDSDAPIFIVGMPRTGTTLVEQILGAHSQVFAAGELPHFPEQVRRTTGSSTPFGLDEDSVRASANLDVKQLGESYLASAHALTGGATRFTDKLPLNVLFLGLINRALPRARIICLRRDPMDSCLSNYRQMFAANFSHYYYNLDLLDCGRYYIGFDQLVKHWRERLPGSLLELQYEALVSNPEQQTRALLTHCGLPFEEQCLSFQEQRSSVATPSAVQVRQGIYTSSVDRWRRYGTAMEPLYELLCEAGLYD